MTTNLSLASEFGMNVQFERKEITCTVELLFHERANLEEKKLLYSVEMLFHKRANLE